jgi:hypothetical protein
MSHSVIVPSPLHTDGDPEQGGKQDCHHGGGVGDVSSAHVRASSICWQDAEITRALKALWHSGIEAPHADAFEHSCDANALLPPPLSLLHAAVIAVSTRQGPRALIMAPTRPPRYEASGQGAVVGTGRPSNRAKRVLDGARAERERGRDLRHFSPNRAIPTQPSAI